MQCPYCDSIIRELPDNRTCPQCGAALAAYCKAEHIDEQNIRCEAANKPAISISFPDPPVGKYKDAAGYLEVGEGSITFYRKHFARANARTIRFEDIFAVSYKPGVTLNSGFLCVREWKDRNIPLVQSSADAVFDETSVYFAKSKNEMFQQVYAFLKQCEEMVHSAKE